MNLVDLVTSYGIPRLEFTPDAAGKWQNFFGVELELESVRGTPYDMPLWSCHDDASLRNGVEFVTSPPMGGSTLVTALDQYYNAAVKCSAGSRTSTHIHINMSDTTLEHLRTLLCVVYAVEDAIFNVVGESRKWSGYAVPLSEMEPSRLRGMMSESDPRLLLSHLAPSRNAERYYGCNTAALRRYGTLEFRYFPGGPTRAELESWIDLIDNLKKNTSGLTIEGLERIEYVGQFISLLMDVVGREWALRLFAAQTASEMFDKFVEAVAMAEASDSSVSRREQLVFVNPALMAFVQTKLLKEKPKMDWFRDRLEQLKVVSQNDFIWYTRSALAYVEGAAPPRGFDEDEPMPIRHPARVPIPAAEPFSERVARAQRNQEVFGLYTDEPVVRMDIEAESTTGVQPYSTFNFSPTTSSVDEEEGEF